MEPLGDEQLRQGRHELAGIVTDWTRFPVVVVTPPPQAVSNEEILASFDLLADLIKLRQVDAIGLVVDLRKAARMSSAQRRMLSDTMSQRRDGMALQIFATSLVFDSVVMRGMLTAVLWFFKPPYPFKAFGDLDEAVAWTSAARGVR